MSYSGRGRGWVFLEATSPRSHFPPEIITLAPSFPSTPGSRGFGLRALPPLRLRKPSIPVGRCPPFTFAAPAFPSAGKVELLSANSDQLPLASNVTCIPPPFDALLVAPRARPPALFAVACLCSLLPCPPVGLPKYSSLGSLESAADVVAWRGGDPLGVVADEFAVRVLSSPLDFECDVSSGLADDLLPPGGSVAANVALQRKLVIV